MHYNFSEHSISTALPLVGLQVWRGALLLGDLALHWGHAGKLSDTTLLEVGAGTGLSSFVTAMYAKRVICTGTMNNNAVFLYTETFADRSNSCSTNFTLQTLALEEF